jgi:hypothetical protein
MTVFIATNGHHQVESTIDEDRAIELRDAGWLVWVGTSTDQWLVANRIVPAITPRIWRLVRQCHQHLVAA